MNDPEFFEDDEPAAEVWARFEAGQKATTAPPQWGFDVQSGRKLRVQGNKSLTLVGITTRTG